MDLSIVATLTGSVLNLIQTSSQTNLQASSRFLAIFIKMMIQRQKINPGREDILKRYLMVTSLTMDTF
jgi:hypothetical protein